MFSWPLSAPRDWFAVSSSGETALADAIRARVTSKGGTLDGTPDAVIDASEDVLKSFGTAQSLDTARPKDWVAAAHTGAVASELSAGRNAGARAGFAKAIGREWPETVARVVNVDAKLDLETAASLVVEINETDNAARNTDSPDELKFVRLRTKKHELIVVPENNFFLVLVQEFAKKGAVVEK